MKRTHHCAQLRAPDIGKEAVLAGWVNKRRDLGGLIFVDLRDREGMTQLVFNPEHNKKLYELAATLKREDVISVKGKVKRRIEGQTNAEMPTGEVEVFADELEIVGRAESLPLDNDIPSSDDTRLKWRYIDLRKPSMARNLRFRHQVAMAAREYFNSQGFLEVETPMLVRSTPEGARDYVVPSRVHPGKFYALPQSPQLYKQLLMIAGVDKYFQFARCLRDEDLRTDRQPEHTQMDLEMSFVEQEDVMAFVEGLYKHIFKKSLGIALEKFPALSYKECMDKYGIDKPDIRFGLLLSDVTDIAGKSELNIFKDCVANTGIVKCICPERDFTRKEIDDLTAFVKEHGAKGLAYAKVTEKGFDGGAAKFFSKELTIELLARTGAKPGSTLFLIADTPKICNEALARLRLKLGTLLGLIDKKQFKFLWVIDFPLFEWDDEAKRWAPAHHMFSMPKKECLPYLESDPGRVIAALYDVVLNGTELGSGSIRIHDPEIQKRVMKVIGMSEEEAIRKFGFLIEAYKYGAPTHGGMGLGFDRLVALMLGLEDIREVIAFPKNKQAQSLMDGCPDRIDESQMKELNIKVNRK